MRAIIVDDEPLALRSMEKLLGEHAGIDIVGKFLDPRMALEAARNERLELAFLDIEMPEIGGLELAELLMELQPHLEIVFVTAYHDYAVEAFELNALDYVLKPVQRNRLEKSLQRVIHKGDEETGRTLPDGKQPWKLIFLQHMLVLDPINGPRSIRWRTTKAQEVFAYLTHHRSQTVRKEKILDLFWPETDPLKSSTHLHTTIYQIRKLLKQEGIDIRISHADDGYRLELGDIQLDAAEWEEGVRSAPAVSASSLQQHRQLMNMYQGDYLSEYDYLWAEGEQERLRIIWLDHVSQVAEYYKKNGSYTDAILCYKTIQEKSPHHEEGYLELMKIYDLLGNYGEVKKQYEKLSSRLEEDLGVLPGDEVADWYSRWSKQHMSDGDG